MEMRGTDVLIREYKKSQDQAEIVEFILRQLLKEQMPFDDIVVLSASHFDGSVASDLTFPVSTERKNRKGKLLLSARLIACAFCAFSDESSSYYLFFLFVSLIIIICEDNAHVI